MHWNLPTIIIGIIILLALAAAVFFTIKNRKKGCSSCSGGCESCPYKKADRKSHCQGDCND
ncbi:MAG: FeoB-associated Cys-rich membrane protein [Parasporobacterium sp.]|nr:FeoB-associated Cys-rich membrane protein [Parasporobacterium sp.]